MDGPATRDRRGLVLCALLLALLAASAGMPAAGAQRPVYFAELSGSAAVPPNESPFRGTFVAQIEDDGVSYRLTVPEIEKAMLATLQFGSSDALGEVIAFVFEPAAASVEGPSERARQLGARVDIVSAIDVRGRITAAVGCGFQCGARLVGSLQGDLDGFRRELAAGNVYVVVRTEAHRDGELRGRVEATSADDPRVVAALAAEDVTRGAPPEETILPERVRRDDDALPAWAWATIIAAVVFGLVAVSTFGRALRR